MSTDQNAALGANVHINPAEASASVAIGETTVRPSERRHLELPISSSPLSPLTLPVDIVNGKYAGPCLCLVGALHGDELNGIEAVRGVLDQVDDQYLHGTLLAVPVANPYAVLAGSRYLPDGRDLNRSFPGSDKGSLAARLASVLSQDLVSRADWLLDFHSASSSNRNLLQIRADLTDQETRRLALAFEAPITLHKEAPPGSLRGVVSEVGGKSLVIEFGTADEFDGTGLAGAVTGSLKMMEALGMLEQPSLPTWDDAGAVAYDSVWLRADCGGLWRSRVELGEEVEEDDVVGYCRGVSSAERRLVASPSAGIVIGVRTSPLVWEGDALMHVALAPAGEL